MKTGKDPVIFNLAAGGGDPFIGLEIIKRTNRMPKSIFIESNFLLIKKVHDETYLNTLYMPGFYQIRRYLPVFKDKYQPVNFISRGLLIVFQKIAKTKTLSNHAAVPKEVIDKVSKLRSSQNKYDSANFVEDQQTVMHNLVVLQEYIDYFKMKGVSICFFEMPRDCETKSNKLSVYSREAVTKFAKKNHLREMPLENCEGYNTSDGLHLTESCSIKYTKFFLKKMKEL